MPKLTEKKGTGTKSQKGWFKKGHGFIGGGSPKGVHNSPGTEFKKGRIPYNYKGGYENTLFLNRQRKVNLKANGGSHTFKEWNDLKKRFNYMCLCCKKLEPEVKLTEDHIVPIKMGGNNYIENIQPLCQSCNSIKGTQAIDFSNNEWVVTNSVGNITVV